jgi:hypothetical protein
MAGKEGTDSRGYHEEDWKGHTIFTSDDGKFSSPNEDYTRGFVQQNRAATKLVTPGIGPKEDEAKSEETGRTLAEDTAITPTATTQVDGSVAKEGE